MSLSKPFLAVAMEKTKRGAITMSNPSKNIAERSRCRSLIHSDRGQLTAADIAGIARKNMVPNPLSARPGKALDPQPFARLDDPKLL
jgi:hypothetical protein